MYDVTAFGAVHDGITDDTSALQAAINACVAGGGGTVYFPNGVYQLAGAPGGWANGILNIPQRSYSPSSSPIAIRLRGEGPSVPLSDAPSGTGMPAMTGAILRASWAGSVVGSPAIISAAPHDSLFGSSGFNWVQLVLQDIEVRAPVDPRLSGIDASGAWGLRWDGLTVSVDAPSSVKPLPTQPNAVGVDMPWGLNAQPGDGGSFLSVDGYYIGLRPSEQTHGEYVSFGHCAQAIHFRGQVNGSAVLRHSTSFGRVLVYWCQRSLVFSGDRRWVTIDVLNVEHDNPPFATVWDIDDPASLGRGFIGWHTTEWATGPGGGLRVTGGAGLSLHGFDAKSWVLVDPPGGITPPPPPDPDPEPPIDNGGTFVSFAQARRTSGDITVSSVGTYANVDTGLDLVVDAQAGDIASLTFSGMLSGGQAIDVDAVTVVGGNVVNSVGAGGGSSGVRVNAWCKPDANGNTVDAGGSIDYLVTAADISSGQVRFRLRALVGSGSATIRATQHIPLWWSVKTFR